MIRLIYIVLNKKFHNSSRIIHHKLVINNISNLLLIVYYSKKYIENETIYNNVETQSCI